MRANGARSKQLDQATFEVRLLDDAIDGVVLVSLLGIIALLPLSCGGSQQYGKAAIAIAIAAGLTSMGVACAMCAGPMGTCGLSSITSVVTVIQEKPMHSVRLG